MPPCSILKEEQQPRITQTNKKKRFVQCRTNRSPYYYEHANKYDTICKQASAQPSIHLQVHCLSSPDLTANTQTSSKQPLSQVLPMYMTMYAQAESLPEQ